MIGIHLQDGWFKNKETWIDEITRDVRTLLKTAEWKIWALEREIRGAKLRKLGTVLLLLLLLLLIVAVVVVVVE
jgi:hypothetical protein